jgi:hypothetical protein
LARLDITGSTQAAEHWIYGVHLFSGLPNRSRIHFEMYDSAGALVTGLAGSITVTLAKNSTVGFAAAATATIVETNVNGYYRLTLDAADLDEPGSLLIRCADAGADDTIIHANVWLRDTFGAL